MNMTETSKLLTIASLIDNRAVSPELVQVWQGLLDDIAFQDAVAAVKEHYRTSTKWLMPAHLRELVTAARREARQAPDREKAATRQWLLDHGIDYLLWEAGDEYTVATVKALVRGNSGAPEALQELP